ncbi:MAG: hypothetical protein AABZ30_14740 [Myxococcota bacterium]
MSRGLRAFLPAAGGAALLLLVVALLRMTATRRATPGVVEERGPSAATRHGARTAPAARHSARTPTSDGVAGVASEPSVIPAPLARPRIYPRMPWSDHLLDEAGQRLAEKLGRNPDEIRLLADETGQVGDAARSALIQAHDLGVLLNRRLEIGPEREEFLPGFLVQYQLRRVSNRAQFRGTTVTGQAIDDAARHDLFVNAEANVGREARAAIEAELPRLPDLVAIVEAVRARP